MSCSRIRTAGRPRCVLALVLLLAAAIPAVAAGASKSVHTCITYQWPAPTLVAGDGPGSVSLGAPVPMNLDLAPGSSGEFVWVFTAGDPGTLTLVGSAAGTGEVTSLTHASAPAPSPVHRVFTAVPRLDVFPTTGLPASVVRGRTDLVPVTLTLANPGDADVADQALVARPGEGLDRAGPARDGRVVGRHGRDLVADVAHLVGIQDALDVAEARKVLLPHPPNDVGFGPPDRLDVGDHPIEVLRVNASAPEENARSRLDCRL